MNSDTYLPIRSNILSSDSLFLITAAVIISFLVSTLIALNALLISSSNSVSAFLTPTETVISDSSDVNPNPCSNLTIVNEGFDFTTDSATGSSATKASDTFVITDATRLL